MNKFIKSILIILVFYFKYIGLSYGQPFYKFSVDSLPYQELSKTFGVFENEYWHSFSGQSRMLPLPFNFNFLGTNYNSVWISKSASVTFFHPQTFLANRIYILNTYYTEKRMQAPFVSSITVNNPADGNDSIFTVQYKNVGFYRTKDTSDFANFQLKLFKNTNAFEIHYGNIKADTSAWLQAIGPYVGIGKDEQSVLVLLGGNPNKPSWLIHRDTMLLGIPKPNTIYRFRPFVASNGNIKNNQTYINVFPNPASDYIQIHSSHSYSIINLMDINGKLIKSFSANETHQYNIADLVSGMYILIVESATGKHQIKLIKN